MTEAKNGEPTPRDLNHELIKLYDMIPHGSYDLEINPDFLTGLNLLIRAVQSGDLPSGQERHIGAKEAYTVQSISARDAQYLDRIESEEFLALEARLEGLLAQSSITPQAKTVIGFQFEDDYADGRRAGDPSRITEVRFPSLMLLDIRDPESEGIFSHDVAKAMDLERELYGSYLDWAEIGSAEGNRVATAELRILHDWRVAFREKYGESPYPNLEPREDQGAGEL